MSSLWHSVVSSLLMAWLCTAFAWGVAGVALASWARLPLWVGAITGAACPVLGVAVLALVAAGRGASRNLAPAVNPPGYLGVGGAQSDSGGWTGMPRSTTGDPETPFGGFSDVGTSWTATGDEWGSRLPAGPPSAWTATPEPAPYAGWGSEQPVAPFGSATAGAATSRSGWAVPLARVTPSIAFGLIAFGALATLFVATWVRISATSELSFSLDAWDLGLGQMMLVTFLEFAVCGAVAYFRRTRWLGVLAVFAGTWWLLLWWVAVQVGGGVRRLVRNVEVRDATLNASYRLGAVWTGILALGMAMTAVGLAHLVSVHIADRSGR